MKKYDTILFDLDGTILDTNELIITSFLEALKGTVDESFCRNDIIPSMGAPLIDQMKKFSGLEEVDHLIEAYRKVNLELHDEYVKAFDNVAEVLKQLHDAGIKMGIVTTKMRLTTEKGLALTGLASFMDAIITIDDVVNPKPHAEPVEKALSILNAKPEHTLMVGDSTFDILAGINAGTDTVGVSWSLKGEQILRDAGAHYIIRDMRELLELVGLERV